MPDYTAEWPLWDGGMVTPSDLGLSDGLAAELQAWQRFFDAHFHWDGGWDSPAAQRCFDDRAHRLHRAVQAELPDVDVELDLWTTPGSGGAERRGPLALQRLSPARPLSAHGAAAAGNRCPAPR